MTARPVLWSFRRCPYAMRARLALASAGQQVELREVVLRDKPQAFLDTSPSATVPCIDTGDSVIDESLDIMIWALERNDPEGLADMQKEGQALIQFCDGPFKTALDRYKYPTRYEGVDPTLSRDEAMRFVERLEAQLGGAAWLFGARPRLADLAILPFIRQFAHVDLAWWQAQPFTGVQGWLARFKASERFAAIMRKYPQWQPGEAGQPFPES
ncbi:glutathione S-transferase [Rhodobacteraceae bacterium 63075]|nr:glutathione S-transferase [Rhodobacteraceae bacterium 63075]